MATSTRGAGGLPKTQRGQATLADLIAIRRAARLSPPPPAMRGPRLEPSSGPSRPLSHDEQIRLAVDYALRPDQPLGQAVARSRAAAPGPAVSGYGALSALVGPNLAARLPGTLTPAGERPGHSAGGTAVDVALLPIPFLRGPRAALRAVRAVKAGEGAGAAAAAGRASMREAGPLTQAYRARKVRLGEQATQFPRSPSRVTALAQAAADRASERLTPTVTRLRESDSTIARGVGRTLTPASARARVPKQAGKLVAKEARRRQALRAADLRAVNSVGARRLLPGMKLEGEQAAHFWYAQLPSSHRNAEGLQLVRAKLAEEHARLTSGAFSESVQGAMQNVRAEGRAAREAGDQAAEFRAVEQMRKLHAIEADVPERIRDVGENITKLDTLIAKPPRVDTGAIDALRALSHDTRDIYVRAGKLKPEVAAERTGLVSRFVGLEPTGEEVYMGHRLGKVKGARASGLPGGVSTGRTQLPAGISKQNTLHLVKTGRVRHDLKAAAEDWQRAQSYEFTNQAKDELAAMGEPIVGAPKPGHVVINPRGHELPRTWKVNDEAQAAAEGFNPDEVLATDLEEYVRNVVAEGADASRMLKAAADAGHLQDLRQVPRDVVQRYFSQFLPAKITVATPGIKEGVSALSKGANLANDLLYLSLIYSNVGYVPAQVVGNTIMAVAHQGALFPANFARATQLLTSGPRQLRDLLQVEHGQSATVAAAQTSPVRAVSGVVSRIADDAFRLSAVMHEAARMGVIPKASMHLSDRDYAALMELATSPEHRAMLNDVGDAATQSMVDFDRLGAKEAAVAKPAGFVWRWIRGATRYPARFALDHPLRTAAIAGGAYAGRDEIHDRLADNMPPYLAGAIDTGTVNVGGHQYPQILPTRSFSPVSTPLETIATLTGQPGAQTIGGLVNPGLEAAWNIAHKRDPWGGGASSYRDAAVANLERLAPSVNLARDLVHPDGSGLYPEDATREGRLKRALRLFPIAIDPEQAYKARVRAGMVPRDEQLAHTDHAFRAKLVDAMHVDQLPPQLGHALDVRLHRQQQLADAQHALGHKLSQQERLAVDVATLVKLKRMQPDEARSAIRWAKSAKERDVRSARTWLTREYFDGRTITETIRFLNAHGADLRTP